MSEIKLDKILEMVMEMTTHSAVMDEKINNIQNEINNLWLKVKQKVDGDEKFLYDLKEMVKYFQESREEKKKFRLEWYHALTIGSSMIVVGLLLEKFFNSFFKI